jgi:hypothetical protein
MKQIGAEIGVNESRVSQLHARAIKRLRVGLADMAPADAMNALKSAVLAFHQKPVMAKASLTPHVVNRNSGIAIGESNAAVEPAKPAVAAVGTKAPAVVVAIKPMRGTRRYVAARVMSRSRAVVAAAR